jgi:hypothetical protein
MLWVMVGVLLLLQALLQPPALLPLPLLRSSFCAN